MNKISLSIIAVLMLAIFITALTVVYSQHRNRQLFVSMQSLMRQQDDLNIQYGRLQLEQSTWASYGRVEKKAMTELTMRAPDINDLQFIVLKAD